MKKRQSQDDEEHSKRKKAKPKKHHTAETHKNKKSTNREDNKSKKCKHKRQITKQQIRNNKESLTPSKHIPRTSNKNMFCGRKKSTKKTMVFERTCSQRYPRGRQNEILVHSIVFPFKCARGAWGEKATKDEKEEE